jgi:hypothetical protein
MRLYEYQLPARIYGANKPELCYSRAGNAYTLYDDTAQPRTEIAQVFWGDTGWTYAGQVRAAFADSFANAKQAMFSAFSRYTQNKQTYTHNGKE